MRRSEFKTLVTIGIIGAIIAASIYGGYIDFTPSTVSAGDDDDELDTTTTVTIENPYNLPDGMSITSASYIIFQNGTLTCAKNGESGYTEYFSANASSVINTVLATSNGVIYFSPGTYCLASSLLVYDDTRLIGYDATFEAATEDVTLISIAGSCDADDAGQAATPIYGTNLITTATAALEVGDTIYLRSDDLYVPWYAYDYMASQHTISRIVNSTTVEVYDTIYLDYQTNTRLIPTDLRSNISVEGITLEGAGPYEDDIGNIGISTSFATGLYFKDVTVLDCSIAAFQLFDTTEVIISGAHVSGSHKLGYGYGVSVGNSAKNIKVYSSMLENCRHGSSNGGDAAGIPAFITYSQCTFRNMESERQHSNGLAIGYDSCTFDNAGRIIIECTDSYITNSFITGSRYETPGDPAYNTVDSSIHIITIGYGSAYPENVRIVNNQITYSFYNLTGLAINAVTLGMAPNCLISGNTFNFTGTAPSSSSGIKIDAAVAFSGVTISDNVFVQSTAYGIIDVNTNAVSSIVIAGNTLSANVQYPIYLLANINNVTISNNQLKGSVASGGIHLNGVEDAVIIGNNIFSTGSTANPGIYIYNCTSVVVSGNNINCPYTGIRIGSSSTYPSSKITVVGNTISSEVGIYIAYTNNVTIANNIVIVKTATTAIYLYASVFDATVDSNTVTGPFTSYVYQTATCKRTTINGLGNNGANNPNATGEWYGFGFEGVMVEWTSDATHYMSVYRSGTWYSWTVS